MADEGIWRGDLDGLTAKVESLAAKTTLGGERMEEYNANVEILNKELTSGFKSGAGAGEVEAVRAALAREKVELQQITEINTANLDVLRKQLQVQLEQVAVRARLQGVTQLGQVRPVPITPAERSAAVGVSAERVRTVVGLEAERLRILEEQARVLAQQEAVSARLQARSAGPLVSQSAARVRAAIEQEQAGPVNRATAQVQAAINQEEIANLSILREQLKVRLEEVTAQQQLLNAPRVSVAPPAAGAAAQVQATVTAAEEGAAAIQRAAAAAVIAADEEAAALRRVAIAQAIRNAEIQAGALADRQADRQRIAANLRSIEILKDKAQGQAYAEGVTAAGAGRKIDSGLVSKGIFDKQQEALGKLGGSFTAAERRAGAYAVTLGQLNTYNADATLSTEALARSTIRLGAVQAEASNELRAHGALTTEYLSALARGETTFNELGYQMGATIGKFAGWAGAAALTYGALGAVVAFGKGALDTASAVQQLTRTIPGLDKSQASTALQDLSVSVNVPVKEAGDAVFAFSRTFHTLDDAVTAAGLALAAYKLDGVAVTDSVKAMTAIHQQFGLTAQEITPIFDELAQGQQKFNARISDQIPLLLKSASAIKAAGGNLRDYIELSTIALRTSSLPGSQVGTAFSRSAANFLSPNTTKGVADRATLQSLGVNPNQDYTKVIFDALKRATQLTPQQVSELSLAIFGPLRGGLLTGFVASGQGLVPSVQRELSPQGAAGTLQAELGKELGTASQQLHAFLVDLEALGAAFANTGSLTAFGLLLKGIEGGINAVRGLLDAFDSLPSSVKTLISGLVELRLAMLFVSRTRIGGSIPGVNQIPGFRPSEGTQARQYLALSNRSTIGNLESDAARTAATLGQTSAKQALLEGKIAAEQAATVNSDAEQVASNERQAALKQRLSELAGEQAALEEDYTIQLAALRDAKQRQVTLTATNRNVRLDDTAAIAQRAGAEASVDAAAGVESGVGATSAGAAALRAQTAAQVRLATAEEALAVAGSENAASAGVLVAEARAALVATTADVAAIEAETATLGGITGAIAGFGFALDPFILGLVALPLVLGALDNSTSNADAALTRADAAVAKPFNTIAGMNAHIKALAEKTNRIATDTSWILDPADLQARFGITPKEIPKPKPPPPPSSQPPGPRLGTYLLPTGSPVGGPTPLGDRYARNNPARDESAAQAYVQARTLAARQAADAAAAAGKPLVTAEQLAHEKLPGVQRATDQNIYLPAFDAIKAGIKADEKTVKNTTAGRDAWYGELADGEQKLKALIVAHPGVDSGEFMATLRNWEQQQYEAIQKQILDRAKPGDQFLGALPQMSDKALKQQEQGYSDRSQAYGLSGGDLQKSAETLLYMAAKYRNSTDPAQLQAVNTGMSTFIGAVNKNVKDLTDAAQFAPTTGAQTADLNKAADAAQHTKTSFDGWAATMEKSYAKFPQIVKFIQLMATQMDAQLNGVLKSAIDNVLTQIQTTGALAESQIGGISPAADSARAQAAINTLQQQLASATSRHDTAALPGLQTSLNNAQTAQQKQNLSDAQALASAQGQLASASIIGLSPADDIARLRAAIDAAQRRLSLDRGAGAGLPAILADQAGVDSAQQALIAGIQANDQRISQDLAAYNDAKAAYAASQTTDPVAKAQDALNAARANLATVKPQDFKTHQEYETALLTAKAKVNDSVTSKRDALVAQDLSTLKFELDTQRISDQQYIAGLDQLLKIKKLSRSTRQQILEEIFNINKSSALNLNVGSLTLPTSYQVRSAMRGALRRAHAAAADYSVAQPGVNTNTTNNITVNVSRDVDLHKVADVFHKATGANLTGVAQSMGLV